MGLSILIVDDSAVMRAMLARTLSLSGLPLEELLQAADGAEALALLRSRPIDLALVDLNMPVMDGEQLIARVQEDSSLAGVAVIVVSTEGSATRVDSLTDRGVAFVHKPFTPQKIRETVLRVLGVANA